MRSETLPGSRLQNAINVARENSTISHENGKSITSGKCSIASAPLPDIARNDKCSVMGLSGPCINLGMK